MSPLSNSRTVRHWGELEWVFSKLPSRAWSIFGCISTGERSLHVWPTISGLATAPVHRYILIEDYRDPEWNDRVQKALSERVNQYELLGGNRDYIDQRHIGDPIDLIHDTAKAFLEQSTESVILDISAMPKRYFFTLLRFFIQSPAVANLIVTYTKPRSYGVPPLSRNATVWDSISPEFRESSAGGSPKNFIVSIGYETLGLPQALAQPRYSNIELVVLFPFPTQGFAKNWDCVRKLEKVDARRVCHIKYINPYDVSEVYEIIKSITKDGKRTSLLAPFGPKCVAVAMALFASQYAESSSAYYTQPKSYNPDYSHDVGGAYAYCVKWDATTLYL
jgi:hypothetical protein